MTRLKAIFLTSLFLFTRLFVYAQPAAYHNNIKPILKIHCTPCHNKSSIGAMPLTNYKEVSAYGSMIQYVTENKQMPPWKADASFAHLKNYNSLTEEEIATIRTWVNNNMPEGKVIHESNSLILKKGSDFGKPDKIISMENAFTVKGDYTEVAQVFVIGSKLEKDECIEAIVFVPGNKKIIKSCTLSIDTGQTGKAYDSNDLNYGYSSLTGLGFIPYDYNFYQWTADEPAATYHFPFSKKLPKGSNILMHITYVASTDEQKDSSYIKIRFVKNNDKTALLSSEIYLDSSHISNGPFVINVGEKRKFFAELKIRDNMDIHSVMPMGQFALSSWEIYASDSLSGQRRNILKIPHWDAHWKKKYDLQNPVSLSAGSTIYAIAYYNNSDDNNNLIILPPKKIRYGEGQRDELFYVQFEVVKKGIRTE